MPAPVGNLPWRWDMGGPGSISIGFAQAPRHLTYFAFVQTTESPSRRPFPASLPKLPRAIENAGYGGKPGALLAIYALVVYSASAVAETDGINTLIGEIVKDSRDYTAQWPIEQEPWPPPASWMRERQFALDRMKALLASAFTMKQGGLGPVSGGDVRRLRDPRA